MFTEQIRNHGPQQRPSRARVAGSSLFRGLQMSSCTMRRARVVFFGKRMIFRVILEFRFGRVDGRNARARRGLSSRADRFLRELDAASETLTKRLNIVLNCRVVVSSYRQIDSANIKRSGNVVTSKLRQGERVAPRALGWRTFLVITITHRLSFLNRSADRYLFDMRAIAARWSGAVVFEEETIAGCHAGITGSSIGPLDCTSPIYSKELRVRCRSHSQFQCQSLSMAILVFSCRWVSLRDNSSLTSPSTPPQPQSSILSGDTTEYKFLVRNIDGTLRHADSSETRPCAGRPGAHLCDEEEPSWVYEFSSCGHFHFITQSWRTVHRINETITRRRTAIAHST
ncbi:hypothetical protein EVAR_20560_1 [Eumeta japonica]|uniref:Uncharacterized protein n=1 Tax=Eumeta variegata TaxID=151549 RepID=A0A4C1URW7_EUMVA|nr:hypothetical protein EVAR_20560_1 [Eumeta japonica]